MKKIVLFLFLCAPFALFAAGPILVDTDGDGSQVVWQDRLIRFNPESVGGLGRLSNAEAVQLVRDLLEEWGAVTLNGFSTVNLSVQEGVGLGDVDEDNVDDFFSYCPSDETCLTEDPPFVLGNAYQGQSPIIFDSDGEITDLIQGNGAKRSILGFGGPRVAETIGGDFVITEGQAILNGLFINCPSGAASSDSCQSPEVTLEEYRGAILHELGHFIGLDHTQVNLSSAQKALRGDDSEVAAIPTMFPIYVDGVAMGSLHYDDQVAISLLYPSASYQSQFCTLSGTIYEADGVTELQGVNVVAARTDSPLSESTSFVSGSYYTGTVGSCGHAAGDFSITGLIPGVEYQVSIEKISQAFTGGSSIEPCDPPLSGFTAETLAGTFSCTTGGEEIQNGSSVSTKVVTTKASTTTGSTGGGSSTSSGGCSLIPL